MLRFKKGQKVFVITDTLEKGSGLKLYEGKITDYFAGDYYVINTGEGIEGGGVFDPSETFLTAREALDNAIAENQKEQTKLADQYQVLIKIEADLKLKEKKDDNA